MNDYTAFLVLALTSIFTLLIILLSSAVIIVLFHELWLLFCGWAGKHGLRNRRKLHVPFPRIINIRRWWP